MRTVSSLVCPDAALSCSAFLYSLNARRGFWLTFTYYHRLIYYITRVFCCQADFSCKSPFEKSSNKCKTLLAKHHFIILHNSVCALLVNLHRLPLFSFCSLLILLYLCQSCQFFLEQFAGGFPSEHLPWVVVNPVLYPLDIVLCPVIEVFSLRYLPAYQSVLVLVAATLK